nr:RagB/SusD family nutrient uptake outer membrane protein [uncultured Draconibacterium sp.]
MKKYNYISKVLKGLVVFSLFFTISCQEEFLEVTPNYYLTEGDFYKTEGDFQQAVIGVYGKLQQFTLQAHFLQEGISDNTTYDNQLDQGSLGGGRQYGFIDQWLMTSDAGTINESWNLIYGAVKDCNFALAGLEGTEIDADVAKQVEGELKFFRAYFYFTAVRYWGDIPLILEPVTTAEDAFAITRSTVEEVYQAIISDVNVAASTLPASYSGTDVGRVTSGAATMLLADVYMTRHEYSKAEAELRKIVGATQYGLLDDYAEVFNPSNKNSKESIFEVQFKEGDEGEASNFMYQFAPKDSRGVVVVGPETANGRNIPTNDMVNAYEEGDLRKDISIGYFDRATSPLYYVKKYDHDTDPEFSRTPDNWPVYRYADALLMLAEAINEQSFNAGEPFELLNEVRNRAGLESLSSADAADQEALRYVLLQERRVELAFENHRWFDLIRSGKAIEILTAHGAMERANPSLDPPDFLPVTDESFRISEDKLIFPIPINELNKNPNLLPQNGNY